MILNQNPVTINDPIEKIIAAALNETERPYYYEINGIDFYLPNEDVYIECKQFHSNRISVQMERVPNIIVVQGRIAAEYLAYLFRG